MTIVENTKFRKFALPGILLLLLVVAHCNSMKYVKAFVPSESHSPNALWIEPSIITAENPGDKFNVTVWANVTLSSFAWQVTLLFNSTYFNVTRAGYTNGSKSTFFSQYSPMSIAPKINNEEGWILCGETLIGIDEREPGFGSLMWVEINLTKAAIQNQFVIDFSKPYGIDTFVITPYFDTIPMESIEGVDISVLVSPTTTITTTTTTPADTTTMMLIAIVGVTTIIIIVVARRRLKKDE